MTPLDALIEGLKTQISGWLGNVSGVIAGLTPAPNTLLSIVDYILQQVSQLITTNITAAMNYAYSLAATLRADISTALRETYTFIFVQLAAVKSEIYKSITAVGIAFTSMLNDVAAGIRASIASLAASLSSTVALIFSEINNIKENITGLYEMLLGPSILGDMVLAAINTGW